MKKRTVLAATLLLGQIPSAFAQRIIGSCPGNSSQTCTADETIDIDEGQSAIIKIKAGTGHCADIRFSIIADGQGLGKTGWLKPGGTGNIFIRSSPTSSLTIAGTGRPGGCNAGSVTSWEANYKILNP